MASWEDGSAAKSLHAGFSASAAVTATSCAKNGISGPIGVFDGRLGFFKAHVQDERYDFAFARVTEGLGETWEALNIAPKAYPCGHYNQPLIYAALALREQHEITPEQISTIRCSVPEHVIPLVAEPVSEKRRPKTSFHGRFSLQHSTAEAMIQGTLDQSSFDTRNLTDPRYNDLADKVQAVIDPLAIDRSQLGGRIEIELYDGRIFSHSVKHMLGMPQNPMSESDLVRKFQMNASGCVPNARVDRITDIIMSLERVDNIGQLMREP
jgi:2-methylcitrate dehydratase PrpD